VKRKKRFRRKRRKRRRRKTRSWAKELTLPRMVAFCQLHSLVNVL
jgi:hypothetical protein